MKASIDEDTINFFVNSSRLPIKSSKVHVHMGRLLKRSEVKLVPGRLFMSTAVRKVIFELRAVNWVENIVFCLPDAGKPS